MVSIPPPISKRLGSFPSAWEAFQAYQLKLLSHLLTRLFSSLARSKYLSVFLLSFIFTQCWLNVKVHVIVDSLSHSISISPPHSLSHFLRFINLTLGLVFCPGLGDLFVPQNPWEFHASHYLGRILLLLLLLLLGVFHISVSLMRASLLKSPWIFSVFKIRLAMQPFGWSRHFFWIPGLPDLLWSLWRPFRANQL